MAKRGHYGRWSENDLLMAVAAYKAGENGLNECSRKFGVPKATIKRHADKNNQVKAMGRQATFTSHMEKVLSEHILQLEKCSFGLTSNEIRKLAFDVAEKHSLPHTFNKEKKIAGKKWFYAFMRRNPQISRIKTSMQEIPATSSDSESSSNEVDNARKGRKNKRFNKVFEVTGKSSVPLDIRIERASSNSRLEKKPRLEEVESFNKLPSYSKKIIPKETTQSVNIVKVEDRVSDFKLEFDELSVKQECSELGNEYGKSEIADSRLLDENQIEDGIKIKLEIDENVDGFEFVDVRLAANDQNEQFDTVNPIS